MKDQIYEYECFVGRKIVKGKPYVLVKWVGYDESENTWEPAANFPAKEFRRKEFLALPLQKEPEVKSKLPKKKSKKPEIQCATIDRKNINIFRDEHELDMFICKGGDKSEGSETDIKKTNPIILNLSECDDPTVEKIKCDVKKIDSIFIVSTQPKEFACVMEFENGDKIRVSTKIVAYLNPKELLKFYESMIFQVFEENQTNTIIF